VPSQRALPAMDTVRDRRVLPEALPMTSVAPAGMTRAPVPLNVPPFHVKVPAWVNVPVPVRVPSVSSNSPAEVASVLRLRVPLLRVVLPVMLNWPLTFTVPPLTSNWPVPVIDEVVPSSCVPPANSRQHPDSTSKLPECVAVLWRRKVPLAIWTEP